MLPLSKRPHLFGIHNKMFMYKWADEWKGRGERTEVWIDDYCWSQWWGWGPQGEGADATPATSIGVGNFLLMKILITLISPSPPHFEGATQAQAHLGWNDDSVYTSDCLHCGIWAEDARIGSSHPPTLRQRPAASRSESAGQEVIPDHPTLLWKHKPNSVPRMRFLFFSP